ncbi:hypothetical protein LTR53_018193, partial [Teratosphaeriaceae sp. CCFEE 6253]
MDTDPQTLSDPKRPGSIDSRARHGDEDFITRHRSAQCGYARRLAAEGEEDPETANGRSSVRVQKIGKQSHVHIQWFRWRAHAESLTGAGSPSVGERHLPTRSLTAARLPLPTRDRSRRRYEAEIVTREDLVDKALDSARYDGCCYDK